MIPRTTRILDLLILIISVVSILLALVLMVSVFTHPTPRLGYTVSGLFSFILMMSYFVIDKRGAIARMRASRVYSQGFDLLLFPSARGEISALFLPESLPVFSPGFIYVMRRADGIYKIGKSTDPTARLFEHVQGYGQDFKLIKQFAVSDMAAFEAMALRMTRAYTYKKETGRKELRKMTKRQLSQFMIDFERRIKN